MKKRSMTKKKSVKEDIYEAPMKTTKKTPTIPIKDLELFIGYVKNLYKIDCIYLWGENFRINVWTEETVENYVYPKYNIKKSFFVSYNDIDMEIVDKTPIEKNSKYSDKS